mmetsp:Transcript_21083/g.30659  ORF Transcript_21083/g.30659 Transcript_21083/m.30659 type:complete len:83 (-) Transcript_21083:1719-1967(-)
MWDRCKVSASWSWKEVGHAWMYEVDEFELVTRGFLRPLATITGTVAELNLWICRLGSQPTRTGTSPANLRRPAGRAGSEQRG